MQAHGDGQVPYMSGTSIVAFPSDGTVLTSRLQDDNLFELSGVTYVPVSALPTARFSTQAATVLPSSDTPASCATACRS